MAPPKSRVRVGHIVHCTFLDHSENGKDSIEFEVIGRVFEITRTSYKIRSWGYVDDIDRAGDSRQDNENWFCIVKKAVLDIRTLK